MNEQLSIEQWQFQGKGGESINVVSKKKLSQTPENYAKLRYNLDDDCMFKNHSNWEHTLLIRSTHVEHLYLYNSVSSLIALTAWNSTWICCMDGWIYCVFKWQAEKSERETQVWISSSLLSPLSNIERFVMVQTGTKSWPPFFNRNCCKTCIFSVYTILRYKTSSSQGKIPTNRRFPTGKGRSRESCRRRSSRKGGDAF